MKIPPFISENPLLVVGAIGAVLTIAYIATRGAKQTGLDIGGGAVNLVFGTASGVGGAIYSNLDDPKMNPLHGVGTALGGAVFDLFN